MEFEAKPTFEQVVAIASIVLDDRTPISTRHAMVMAEWIQAEAERRAAIREAMLQPLVAEDE